MKKDIAQELVFIGDLKSLVSVYEQLSALRLQAIRGHVLKTRHFSASVSSIVSDIRGSYRRQLEKLARLGKLKEMLDSVVLRKSKRLVSVLVSPNQKWSGQIVNRQLRFFLESVKDGDLVVVGKVGKSFMTQIAFKKTLVYFDLPDHPESADLKSLITHLLQYAEVNIYHNKFNTLLSQEVVRSDITGEKLLFSDAIPPSRWNEERKFLFEPRVGEILVYLESQLLALFLKQAIHESDLANLGSRVTSLEAATRSIDRKISKLKYQKIIQKRFLRNREQRQMLSGMRLWRTNV
ncbi:F0F1 ATP synthase subunit gamma [Candidatus Daviesbacteria bacterium]|nr:F0F1 ATP synthase subunit gamma [Candidatus Daviesbacteria bacterium]